MQFWEQSTLLASTNKTTPIMGSDRKNNPVNMARGNASEAGIQTHQRRRHPAEVQTPRAPGFRGVWASEAKMKPLSQTYFISKKSFDVSMFIGGRRPSKTDQENESASTVKQQEKTNNVSIRRCLAMLKRLGCGIF